MLYPRAILNVRGDDENAITLAPALITRLGLSGRRRLRVRLGEAQTEVEVRIGSAQDDGGICVLGGGTAAILGIGGRHPVELKVEAGALEIGPVIALLLPEDNAEATLGTLPRRLLPFPQIRGLVVALTLADLRASEGDLTGWLYDHEADAFKRGPVPTPRALYILGPDPGDEALSALGRRFGGRVINQPLPEGAEVLGAIRRRGELAPCLEPVGEGEIKAHFSLYLQRDQSAFWRITAHLGRLPDEADAPLGDAAAFLVNDLGHTEEEAFILKEEMAHSALGIAHLMEGLGAHLGELVVDFTLTESGAIRLKGLPRELGVPEVALALGDGILYHRLLSAPLFYAKALAGFPMAAF